MKTLDHKLPFLIVFYVSLQLLLLQIVLSLLLRVFTHLPFLAISFAFLGSSAAGVYYYIRYQDRTIADPVGFMAKSILVNGSLLLIYVGIIKLDSILRSRSLENMIFKVMDGQFSATLQFIVVRLFLSNLLLGVLFSVSFFGLGLVITMLYRQYSDRAPKLYLYDLCGASLGCLLGVYLLNVMTVSSILIFLSFTTFVVVFLIADKRDPKSWTVRISTGLILLSCGVFLFNVKTGAFEIKVNPHILANDFNLKKECKEMWFRWNAYSRIALIRHKLPQQEDYDHTFAIDGASGRAHLIPFDPLNPYGLELFDKFTPVTLAFMSGEPKDILILFVGTGKDMIEAYSYSRGKADITGVEINPLIVNKAVSLPEFHLQEFFDKDNVHMVVEEGRTFLERTDRSYDAIILSWSGSSLANYLRTSGFTGQYLHTKEAVKSYLEHLKPGGVIGIVNGSKIRLLAMIKEAFEEMGYDNIDRKVILLERHYLIKKGISQAETFMPNERKYLLVKNTDFTQEETGLIKANADKMGIDLIYTPYYYHPDFPVFSKILNVDNTRDYLHWLSDLELKDFSIPTDNRPFLYNLFLTKSLLSPRFWKALKIGHWNPHLLNNLIHVILFCFIIGFILIGFLFILIPMLLKKRVRLTADTVRVLYYFSALGLGFIFVEIAVMQHFSLLLGNPIYSFSIVLASLLLSTGAGSILSDTLFGRGWLTIKTQALIVFYVLIIYYYGLPKAIEHLLPLSLPLKILMTFCLVTPLGISLGMLFPQGLRCLHKAEPNLIPWAWALNGYMTIIGSLLSIYLSFAFGFSIFLMIGAFLYLSLATLDIKIFS